MGEYFEKYKDFERKESNSSIDKPLIYLWEMTAPELILGLSLMVLGLYLASLLPRIGLIMILLSIALPALLKQVRQRLPRNIFHHVLWHLGVFNKELPSHLKRPTKRYLGP